MAKIVITIQDKPSENGLSGISVTYEGDFLQPLQSGVTYTPAQGAAASIKSLMDFINPNQDYPDNRNIN